MQQMVTHPARARSYWHLSPRGFGNEYEIGIATSRQARQHYQSAGYERIDRHIALKWLCDRGDAATQIYCSVSIDGESTDRDRFELARSIREGGAI